MIMLRCPMEQAGTKKLDVYQHQTKCQLHTVHTVTGQGTFLESIFHLPKPCTYSRKEPIHILSADRDTQSHIFCSSFLHMHSWFTDVLQKTLRKHSITRPSAEQSQALSTAPISFYYQRKWHENRSHLEAVFSGCVLSQAVMLRVHLHFHPDWAYTVHAGDRKKGASAVRNYIQYTYLPCGLWKQKAKP